ncbi:hypothetical protein [Neisseria sp. Ec49-e6-T10]|uniref:hypothetical protein n=1 Tax=Neisseria sp. Ec49-e6-T10 TaxID=3140744 RepID=UPI003EBCE59B
MQNFAIIEAVTDDLIKNLSEKDKNIIQSTKESELLKFHFKLGTMIHNQYGAQALGLVNSCFQLPLNHES